METKSSARYIHPRVAVCKKCEGKGIVYNYDEVKDETTSCGCPICLGSGRVKVSSSVVTTILPFVPGRDDKDGVLFM